MQYFQFAFAIPAENLCGPALGHVLCLQFAASRHGAVYGPEMEGINGNSGGLVQQNHLDWPQIHFHDAGLMEIFSRPLGYAQECRFGGYRIGAKADAAGGISVGKSIHGLAAPSLPKAVNGGPYVLGGQPCGGFRSGNSCIRFRHKRGTHGLGKNRFHSTIRAFQALGCQITNVIISKELALEPSKTFTTEDTEEHREAKKNWDIMQLALASSKKNFGTSVPSVSSVVKAFRLGPSLTVTTRVSYKSPIW